MIPIKFCSFGGYRLLCDAWWYDLIWYVTGIKIEPSYNRDEFNRFNWIHWRRPGWLGDILAYWHRARYGWASKDTWSLDTYLEGVLGGALAHLAEHSHGCPGGYPDPNWDGSDATWDVDTGAARWEADLKRWALAFREAHDHVDIYDRDDDYVRHRAEEVRRQANLKQALAELTPWWEALWD